jgi:hypothetical protein
VLQAITDAGHLPLVKPWPIRPWVPGGFDLDDLTVDEAAGALTCPNGVTRPITKTRTVRFGIHCAGCPLRDRCTTAAKGRSLHLHQPDALQREHRRAGRDPAGRPATGSTGQWRNPRSPGW